MNLGLHALIDGDIFLHEIGHGAETGWGELTKDPLSLPPFDYVEELLLIKLENILERTKASSYTFYLTRGKCFRYDVAKTRPYKANRIQPRPWHYDNIKTYLIHQHPSKEAVGIEADDLMGIDQYLSKNTIICSRDKDLRMIPGWYYSWEVYLQPEIGPEFIEDPGYLIYEKSKLKGSGYAWFSAQMLTGDQTDNVVGLPGWGPSKAYHWLKECNNEYEYDMKVLQAYEETVGEGWTEYWEEHKQLLWILREI